MAFQELFKLVEGRDHWAGNSSSWLRTEDAGALPPWFEVAGKGLWLLECCVCPREQWVLGSGMRPSFAIGLLARAADTFPLDI